MSNDNFETLNYSLKCFHFICTKSRMCCFNNIFLQFFNVPSDFVFKALFDPGQLNMIVT